MSSQDHVNWLSEWYLHQCDGEWEHRNGLTIESLDNPGWRLRVDLAGTELDARTFQTVQNGAIRHTLEEWRQYGSWWTCEVKDNIFHAACGPRDLIAVIGVFRAWIEDH